MDSKPHQRRRKIVFLSFSFAFLALTSLLLLSGVKLGKVHLREGSIAEYTIKAPRSVLFESASKTEEARAGGVTQVGKVYSRDQHAFERQEKIVGDFFDQVHAVKASAISDEEKRSRLRTLIPELSSDQSRALLSMDDVALAGLESRLLSLLGRIQSSESISEENREAEQNYFVTTIPQDSIGDERSLVQTLGPSLLTANSFYDAGATEAKITEEKQKIPPVSYSVSKDEVIIYKGEQVTTAALEKLSALGMLSTGFDFQNVFGVIAMNLLLGIGALVYIAVFQKRYRERYTATLLLFTSLAVVTVLAASILLPIKPILGYLIPVASFAGLMLLLTNFEMGLMSAVLFSLWYGLAAENSFELLVIQLALSLVAVLTLRKTFSLQRLVRSGAYMSVTLFLVSLAFHVLAGSFSATKVFQFAVIGMGYGAATVVIIYGSLSILSNVFRMTTPLRLLELANPTSPLLRRLSLEAAGTYHHSLMVSHLAEEAAKSIGADILLAKVGSLYHDIGKLYDPSIFIENQTVPERLDETESLKQSAEMIARHVPEGVKLASEARLPREIIHIIESHHGTTWVSYFYQLLEERGKERVQEKDFRYPGPKPRTRVEVIVMIADSVEAATRALKHKDAEHVSARVSKVIYDKLNDRQLDEADITLRDLELIRESCIGVLEKMRHSRIEYESSRAS